MLLAVHTAPHTMDPHDAVGPHAKKCRVTIDDSPLKRDHHHQFIPGLAASWQRLSPTSW